MRRSAPIYRMQRIVANRWPVTVDTRMPMVHYLSNGHYGLLITNAGGGYSQWMILHLPAGGPIRRWITDAGSTCRTGIAARP